MKNNTISKTDGIKALDKFEDFVKYSLDEEFSRLDKTELIQSMGERKKLSGTITMEYNFSSDNNEIVPTITVRGGTAVKLLLSLIKKIE